MVGFALANRVVSIWGSPYVTVFRGKKKKKNKMLRHAVVIWRVKFCTFLTGMARRTSRRCSLWNLKSYWTQKQAEACKEEREGERDGQIGACQVTLTSSKLCRSRKGVGSHYKHMMTQPDCCRDNADYRQNTEEKYRLKFQFSVAATEKLPL